MENTANLDAGEYCRRIETYLCQKNHGHLIRIVGPAFEKVTGWADQGVPLSIAFRGIDRYCERYYAKPGRRRPVRIEFCEADILESFDDWRRAIGVAPDGAETAAAARKPALVGHVDRVLARLVAVRDSGQAPDLLAYLETLVREIDDASRNARQARGEARERIVARLEALDREMMSRALASLEPDDAARLRREARAELGPLGDRMDQATRERAVQGAFERLARQFLGLPIIRYE